MLVIDASVAAKWFVAEDDSTDARALLVSGESLVAPDLLIAEVCNALWKKVQRREIESRHAVEVAMHLPGMFDHLAPTAGLVPRALELAITLTQPVYDCLYIALAELAGAPLVTADTGLARAARRAGLPPARIRLLPPLR